jgi:hypothetical protein
MHIKTAHGYTAMERALNWPVSDNDSDFETRAAIKAQMVALFQQYDHGTRSTVGCLVPRFFRMLISCSVLGIVRTSVLTPTAPVKNPAHRSSCCSSDSGLKTILVV